MNEARSSLIDPDHPKISIARQCLLLGVNRSGYYYCPAPESSLNIELTHLIDKLYTDNPFYGIRRITAYLQREGFTVNHKRVSRMMNLMGIQAIYPKPKLSSKHSEHKIYPYLLKDKKISFPDQVWSTDITYIRMQGGFLYLAAIMDWFSRYVLAWRLSNTMDSYFCQEMLYEALLNSRPVIFNSDQGSQFTSLKFTKILEDNDIAISMDGRGRFYDNIFIERLWRTVKYEDIYLRDYRTISDVHMGLDRFFKFYNNSRLHQSLRYKPPVEVYQSAYHNPAVSQIAAEG